MRKLMVMCFLLPVVSFVYAQKNADSSLITHMDKHDTAATATIKENELESIPVISLDDDAAATKNISSPFAKGRDPFYTAATFSFSPTRFLFRGYDRDNSATYMNGARMEDLATGTASAGQWRGLSDEMHNRYVTLGLQSNTFGFGDIGTSTNLDTRASKQRTQTSISGGLIGGLTSTTWYKLTGVGSITHSVKLNKGWAFTISGTRRFADQGYVEGTYYNDWSGFIGVDKQLTKKQLLSLVVFSTLTEDGLQGSATKESFNLANSNYYNPDWGYQNGKQRNAHVAKSFQPVGILTHEFTFNKNTSLLTAVSYSAGDRSTSRIDWYNAPNPAPDYYTKLPSYQTDFLTNNPALAALIADSLRSSKAKRQLSWEDGPNGPGFYTQNRRNATTITNVDGIPGKTVSGNRSVYALQERVTNTKKFNFNTTLNTQLSSTVALTGGLSYQFQKNNYYERVADLLGGDFYVDVDQYAQQDFPGDPNAYQNNVKDPNRILHVGDKYGYNYDININKASGWLQSTAHLQNADVFVAGQLSNTAFWRVGNVQNGLFPNNSLGKSSVNDFTNYAIKAGVNYKLDHENSLYANLGYLTKAPNFQDSYLDPQIRDDIQTGLSSENITTAEGGYVLNAAKVKLRVTGYYTTFKNEFQVIQYFDYIHNEFIDYGLRNINKVNFGGEFAAEANVAKNVTVTAAASVGRYYYDSRQLVTITQDNNTNTLTPTDPTVYMKNYRLPNTPQEAYNLGVNYHSPKYWFVSLAGNYFDQMWIQTLPDRRTVAAVQGYKLGSAQYNNLLNQEKFAGQFTLDLRGGHSWKLGHFAGSRKPLFLSIDGGINNLLNNTNIISSGREGGEDASSKTGAFDSKYEYAYGINYFIKATIRFY